ncbi:hypothetical protein ACHAW5_008045 [Stephanodiscus triporus]|uniref:Uncharacterized protein n=1 Tax=Stephanodiscus triporus TaxID=2934178 RepID=A0ABD3QEB4_9STRA
MARPLANRVPVAVAAYEALALRRRAGTTDPHPPSSFGRPDPAADRGGAPISSNLLLEAERVRHVNLELHMHLKTPAHYAEYGSLLENDYSNPMRDGLVDKNRRLGRALGTLEGEGDALRKEAAATVVPPPHDDGEGRRTITPMLTSTSTSTSTMIMEISEINKR